VIVRFNGRMITGEAMTGSVGPLKERMRKAASWFLTGSLLAQGLRLGSSLILTRLLMPEAFGLMAAVNTLYIGLLMFSDLGIWQSVVRSPRGRDERFLGTAWLVQVLRGVLLATLVLLLALLVQMGAARGWFAPDTVYADPRLPAMIALFAIAAVVQGLESIRLATAQRDLQGRRIVQLELVTQLVTIAVTVAAAWLSGSVWALLIGTLSATVTKTVLSYLLVPGPRVRPRWDGDSAREIVGFGKWVFVSSIIGFLAAHGEKLLLGATLGVAAFGVFTIASNLLAALIAVYSTLNGKVVFPSLSQVAVDGDPAVTRRLYARLQRLVDGVLGVLSGVLLFTGSWLVELLYDSRYVDAGWMLQWLAVGLLGLRYQVLEQLMFAAGRPGWVSANNALRAVSLVVFIPLGHVLGGEQGAIAGVVLSQFASWPLSLRFKYEQGLLDWTTENRWLPAVTAGIAIGLVADQLLVAIG
jgi:O-antigen/teichoic acid export membrane protein